MKMMEEKIRAAKDLALKALGNRDLTRKELIELLVQKRMGTAVADAAVGELEETGIVDDRRVASEHARRRMEADAVARPLLEAELLERGIEAGLAQAVIHEQLCGRDESAELLELAREKVRTSPARLAPEAVRRRVFAYLMRRGYDEELAREAVERAAEEYLGRA
jgi:regulatory protein